VIVTVRDLADALAAQAATVEELVARLGGEATDMTGSVLVEDPPLEGVARASVVRQADGREPALLTLELSPPIAVDELSRAFGTPRRIHPDHLGEPVTLVYDVDVPDRPYAVTLLATEDVGGSRRLTLRRDVRLG
jgi:hypothetical protein